MMPNATPVATILFILTIGFSVYSFYLNKNLIEKFALNPYAIKRHRKYASLILSGFLHSNFPHLLFNMLSFYFFAFPLERAIGSLNFLIIFIGSLIIANIPTVIKEKDNPQYRAIGASGAISGVIFSFILFEPMMGILIFPIPFPLPAFVFGILYLLWSYFAAKQERDLINHSAHFWGAISGIILTIFLEPNSIKFFLGNFVK